MDVAFCVQELEPTCYVDSDGPDIQQFKWWKALVSYEYGAYPLHVIDDDRKRGINTTPVIKVVT